MSKSIARICLLIAAGTIAVATTSCGASKVSQCNSIAKVTKEVETAAKDFDSPDTKDPAKAAQIFSNMAVKSQGFSKTIQALDLQDEKLKNFQLRLVTMYESYNKTFSKIAPAIKAKDAAAFNSQLAEIKSESVKEEALGKELSAYCTGK
ncbi:hypothetical protein [Chamaesiphon sp. VAR_69_metabat_338]|uniref:hypothetical protein n=1 Tax=Chamaesiphon sp. VAR_69_metabat_338 TaxID=2964704 RepID=UPI00286EA942|nr:hypothetical protein [Chamaesiphon sp. VAR_69_metabat_338]